MRNAIRSFYYYRGGQGYSEGQLYLMQNAKAYWDFTALSGADGSPITSVSDSGPNRVTLSNELPAETPTIQYFQFGETIYPTFKAHIPTDTDPNILLASTTGDAQFTSDFEIIFTAAVSHTGRFDFFGVNNGSNIVRLNRGFGVNTLRFEYRYSAATARRFVADTPSPFFPDEKGGMRLYHIKCDFTNDIFKFWVDGVEITMTSLVDAFNLIDPSLWVNNIHKFAIGAYNNGGTFTFNDYNLFGRFAITPIMTDRQASMVSNYFTDL